MSVFLGWFAKTETRIVIYAPTIEDKYVDLINHLLTLNTAIMVFGCDFDLRQVPNKYRQYILVWGSTKNIIGGLTHSDVFIHDDNVDDMYLKYAVTNILLDGSDYCKSSYPMNIKCRGE